MGIGDILGRFKSENMSPVNEEDQYVELELPGAEIETGKSKILIQVEKLNDYMDSDRIQKKVREGNILLVRIKELKDKDIGELKRAIARIRKTCIAVNGDIAGVSDEWIIVTPSFAKVHRESPAASAEHAERPAPIQRRAVPVADDE